MKADELIELLKADYADGISQSGVVDEKASSPPGLSAVPSSAVCRY